MLFWSRCYREIRERYHAQLQEQLEVPQKVLRAQSYRGWKAALKGADLEKREGGFISWMLPRYYSGRFGMMEAVLVWRDHGVLKCTDDGVIMHGDVVHAAAGWW